MSEVRLPDEIALTAREVSVVLEALDLAIEDPGAEETRSELQAAKRLLIGKMWPDLGELLDDE